MRGNAWSNYVYPVATVAGSIVGVGFLSLPYVTLQVGVWPMLSYALLLVGAVAVLHVMYAKICLVTPDRKQLPGVVEYYLGPHAKKAMLVLTVMGSLGILLSYLIVGGKFLAQMMAPVFPGGSYFYTLLLFIVLAGILYADAAAIPQVEFFALFFLVCALALVWTHGFSLIKFEQLVGVEGFLAHDLKTLFLPFGVIIFSLWGTPLIPQAEEMLRGRKKLLIPVVILATLLPAAFYLLFTVVVLGISGTQTTETALTGLGRFLGSGVELAALLIGFITAFAAFIGQGLFLKRVLSYDLKIRRRQAWMVASFPVLLLFFAGFDSLIPLISFVGGVFLGIEGLFIAAMYLKIGGKKLLALPMMAMFLLGIAYSVIYAIL